MGEKTPIEDEERAIEIAKAYVFKKYKDNFDEYEIKVTSDDDIWIVWYEPILKNPDWYLWYTYAVHGPVVHINKSNGKVVYCDLSPVTKKRATEIAKAYAFKKYNSNFNTYKINHNEEYEDTWYFSFAPINFNNSAELEDHSLAIHIRKSNGEVIYCFFSATDEESIDEERAIEIAKEYSFRKYNKTFDEYELVSYLKDDVWHVWYSAGVVGGGLPAVYIKTNGEVIWCWLTQ
ncbi:MAG: hypothetical protein FWH46_04045 [Methanimicrococcus sp.]|nr:hypothetical protein [Methanimicrococcus sp.]